MRRLCLQHHLHTIFLGAALSLILYVVAAARKLRVQQAVRLEDGVWEMRDAPRTLAAGEATVIVVLDDV